MERLVSEDGQLYACGNNLCRDENVECTDCRFTNKAFVKLGKYEDTKLQPEQVEKLKEKNKTLQKENRKLKKEMLNMLKYAWYNQEDEDEQE